MKILTVAFPFALIRPSTAGGAEQVVAMLDRALCRAGHQSLVIAHEGSQVEGELLPTPGIGSKLDAKAQSRIRTVYQSAVAEAVERRRPDLVHLHGLDFIHYLPPDGVAAVATLHLPPAWYSPEVFTLKRPHTWLHCVSRLQQSACPAADNLLPFIDNGVREDLAARHVKKRELVVALGRICPEKGFHFAFEAADIAGVPFLLAGQVYGYEEHTKYFHEQIAPRCDRRKRFIGTVGLRQKKRLLTAAKCLLIPSLAQETSSLVAMEAAMCGTPTVAFRSGALATIVEDGVTGFVVDDVRQMAAAIRDCSRIDTEVCRRIALARFSERRTITSYLQMYQKLLRQ